MHTGGQAPVLDIAMSFVEKQSPSISDQALSDCRAAFTEHLVSGKMTFEACKTRIEEIIGSAEPAEEIHRILSVEETPLNEFASSDEGEVDLGARRKARNWNSEEDDRLIAGIYRYGLSEWARISKFVGNHRTRSQCSQRWHRSLNPHICKTRWTTEDDQLLLSLVGPSGECHSWTKVAKALGSRSDVQCRYRHQILTRKVDQSLPSPRTSPAPQPVSKTPKVPSAAPKDSVKENLDLPLGLDDGLWEGSWEEVFDIFPHNSGPAPTSQCEFVF